MSIKVMLVDDHNMVSEVLCALLEKEADMEVVATADNGRDATRIAKEIKPDIIVMDVAMPEMNGLDACRHIMADSPQSRIIILSMYSDRKYIVEALKAGAKGYIQKKSAFLTLVEAIRSVNDNNGFLDPKITDIVMNDYCHQLNDYCASNEQIVLSSREREVLQLIAEGKNTKEIAYALDISSKTVETHRRQIMHKLRLSNVADLTKYAIREGIASL